MRLLGYFIGQLELLARCKIILSTWPGAAALVWAFHV